MVGHKARMYRKCCSGIINTIAAKLREEKKNSRLHIASTKVSERLVYLTGLSSSTLYKLLHGNVPDNDYNETRNRKMLMDIEDEMKIRPAIINLVKEKKMITLSQLQLKLKSLHPEWKWGRTTLSKTLGKIGFKFNSKRHNYYDRLRENEENIQLRAEYIRRYFNYVEEERQIVFMDESWINQNHVRKSCWHDNTTETVDKVPPGKGPRWIMLGAGSKDGWIPNSFRMWKGNVKSEDYHTEMNGDVFKNWLLIHLLPNVNSNAVIVIDRAPYHTELTEYTKAVTSTMKKPALVAYLLEHNFETDGVLQTKEHLLTMKNKDLILLCREVRPPKRMKIEDLIIDWNTNNNTDIRFLILPIAIPQLNPIEMVWSWIKNYVGSHNHDFKMGTIHTLVTARVAEIDGTWWTKACTHSDKFAIDQDQADDIFYDAVDDPNNTVNDEDDDGALYDAQPFQYETNDSFIDERYSDEESDELEYLDAQEGP